MGLVIKLTFGRASERVGGVKAATSGTIADGDLKSSKRKSKRGFFRRTGISMTRGFFCASLQISLIHVTTTVAKCYF